MKHKHKEVMGDKTTPEYFAHKWVQSQTTREYTSPYKSLVGPGPLRYKPIDPPLRRYASTSKKLIMPLPAPSPPPLAPPPTQSTQPTQQNLTRDPRFFITFLLNPHCSKKSCLQCLPKEVRCMIWNYARSRTIGIIIIMEGIICSRSPSPITFRINQESRYESQKHYTIHEQFYIQGTEDKAQIPYPFFDPKVDSVVLLDGFMGSNPARSSTVFGFYGPKSVIKAKRDSHLDVIQSLVIPAHAWDWGLIHRSPRADIRFGNLTEIIFQGGEVGLTTPADVERCKEVIRGCFERSVEEIADEENNGDTNLWVATDSGRARKKKLAKEIKVPEVRVYMPKGLENDWMFEEGRLGMESVEERTCVMNFISKVKAGH